LNGRHRIPRATAIGKRTGAVSTSDPPGRLMRWHRWKQGRALKGISDSTQDSRHGRHATTALSSSGHI
jgi:hypothetical protein